MDVDDLLLEIGEWGKYQKYIIWFILLPGVFPCGFHAYDQLFIAAKPKHWCKIPEIENSLQENFEFTMNLSIPYENKDNIWKFSECYMYDKNYSNLEEISNRTISCQNGYYFDKTHFKSTVISEWDLVCDSDFYPTLALILFGVAGLIGNYIFGYAQDILGRKPAFFIYLTIQNIFGIATAFTQNYMQWLITRFGVGLTIPAILASPYVLAIELVGPSKRTLCTILSNIAYSLSLITLSIIVWLITDWRILSLTTSLPFILFFIYIWFMPESPRWLISKGRYQEAHIIFEKISKMNNKPLPTNYLESLKVKYKNAEKTVEGAIYNYGIKDLFRTKNLCRKTIIITFIWFTNTSVYVGLSYYAPALGGNEFLNFFLAALVELPTYIFLWPAMDYWGRRWTLSCSMILGGTACLATFLVKNDKVVTLALYCIGKMGISSSFVVLQLIASEIYPTVVRGLGISFSSVVGMLGPIFIPLINYLGSDMIVLPLIIMGILLVLGGLSGLLLPETLGKSLPQTIEDSEEMKVYWNNCCELQMNINTIEQLNSQKKFNLID